MVVPQGHSQGLFKSSVRVSIAGSSLCYTVCFRFSIVPTDSLNLVSTFRLSQTCTFAKPSGSYVCSIGTGSHHSTVSQLLYSFQTIATVNRSRKTDIDTRLISIRFPLTLVSRRLTHQTSRRGCLVFFIASLAFEQCCCCKNQG